MSETKIKQKPRDDTKLKTKFILSQCNIQQSFKQPSGLSNACMFIVYIQCLKYTVDFYSQIWFGKKMAFFAFADLSYYSEMLPSVVISSIGLAYVLWSFLFGLGIINGKIMFKIGKVLQILFGTLLFKSIIGGNCISFNFYFFKNTKNTLDIVLSFFCLMLFSATICLQTFTRYEFLFIKNKVGTNRSSNWSSISLLIYVLVNEVAWQCSDQTTSTHAIIRDICFVLHAFVFFLKWEIEEEPALKIELSGLAINLVAILLESTIELFGIQLGIGFLGVMSAGVLVALFNLHYFNINFELENVNKWTNSQIMISYASKLRKLLRNYDNYYYNTLLLGYIEIHDQKCDNETCPLKNISMVTDENMKKSRFEEIIKKIYKDGYNLSPINPELQLEYSIFFYEAGAREKSLKTLLEIKEEELPLDKFYKFIRLKKIIHEEISEIPDQEFLDLISEIKVKDLEEKIVAKFEESSLVSLEFWSILNEDHPDFKKLYDVGKSRVIVLDEIESLHQQIKQIAHSERITALYIHYLNLIVNEEKMFSEVEGEFKKEEGFEDKIVIEDWSNSPSPIMIVSLEEENYGVIIDLNTTCATLLNHEKFDFIGKDIKTLFSGVLSNQVGPFMDSKVKAEQPFFINFSSVFSMRVFRRIQLFSSINTGLSLIITLDYKFQPNTCFLVFNQQSKLEFMSSSAIALLGLEQELLETECLFTDIFSPSMKDIDEEKITLTLNDILSQNRVTMRLQKDPIFRDNLINVFNITKNRCENFRVLNFQLLKRSKKSQYSMMKLQLTSQFTSQIVSEQPQNSDLFTTLPPVIFYFSTYINEGEFIFISSEKSQKCFSPQQNIITMDIGQSTFRRNINFAEHITTLRLCDGYIKVLEECSENSDDGELNSVTSTNTGLIEKQYELSKVDQQKIFENRKSYHQFIQKNTKRVYTLFVLIFSIVTCCSMYIGVYFQLKNNYDSIQTSYNRYALGNRIIGQIAEANRIVYQSKYQSLVPEQESVKILKKNYIETLTKLQDLMTNYTYPYIITVYINRQRRQDLKSDQFLLSYISQFAKINSRVVQFGLANFTGEDQNSIFIEMNGDYTKINLYPKAQNFKQTARSKSKQSFDIFVSSNIAGVILALILTFFILLSLKNINEYKVDILSVFLEITDKEVQNYSQKTQAFLVTLHVDESNEKNQLTEQAFDNKSSSAMFAKKKRFKQTNFQKTPYIIMSFFLVFAVGFFIQLFSYTLQKSMFIENAIQYFGVVSNYADIYAKNQAKVYKKLFNNINAKSPVTDPDLCGQINTQILSYERELFAWHFRTFSSIASYHEHFSNVYMKNICNNGMNLEYSCYDETMSKNGTLLMITDVTIDHELIDYSQPLNRKIFFSIESIKKVHEYLLGEVLGVSRDFFTDIRTNIITILLIWMATVIFVGFLLLIYLHKVIMQDLQLVKRMLKFFPVSFARKSQGIRKFVGAIIGQKTK